MIKTNYKISIITPSYNQGNYIEQTIKSVLDQNYCNLEYLIVDGGSNDHSLDIIQKYENHIDYWVSEKDRGQVHALNKGIAKCTGDIFAFINSDDMYLPGAFAAVIEYFSNHPECSWVCGDTIMFGEGHKTELYKAVVPISAAHALAWEAHCPQPGMFWKRELIESGFNEEWPYDFDHEMYIRLLLQGYKCHYLPVPLAAYRLHAVSKTVAEGHRQEAEFDMLSEHYEQSLNWTDRRWCRSVRLLRESKKRIKDGRRGEAFGSWFKAITTYPEGVFKRPYLGTLKEVVTG